MARVKTTIITENHLNNKMSKGKNDKGGVKKINVPMHFVVAHISALNRTRYYRLKQWNIVVRIGCGARCEILLVSL